MICMRLDLLIQSEFDLSILKKFVSFASRAYSIVTLPIDDTIGIKRQDYTKKLYYLV